MTASPRAASSATIIPLEAVDPAMIEEVLDRAFGPDRHARTAYRIREGMAWLPGLSLAALDEDDLLVATIQCWPVGCFLRSFPPDCRQRYSFWGPFL